MDSRQHEALNSRAWMTGRVDELLIRLGAAANESADSLDVYFAAWLKRREPSLAPSTIAGYELTYRYYVAPYLGQTPIQELTVTGLVTWLNALLVSGGRSGQSLAAATVQYARLLLHKVLEDAVAEGALLVNPASRTQSPRRDIAGQRQRRQPASWTIEELRLFLDAVDSHRLGPLFTLLATTGMRRGEGVGLSWNNIDLDRREINVQHGLTLVNGEPNLRPPKGGRARRITIGDRAIDALELQHDRQRTEAAKSHDTWANPLGLVFAQPDGSYLKPEAATYAFRYLTSRLPVTRIRLHDLRHTHAILLLQAGSPVTDVAQRLGHANPSVTLRYYAKALQQPSHAVAEAFDRLLDNQMWEAPSTPPGRATKDDPMAFPAHGPFEPGS